MPQVIRMLGNGRLEGHCFDGQTRLCHIRGKMRKKVWVNQGDIILIGLRDFQDSKADVILKYTSDEARRLKAQGELPDSVRDGSEWMGLAQMQCGRWLCYFHFAARWPVAAAACALMFVIQTQINVADKIGEGDDDDIPFDFEEI
jgi:initiation factor 1A